MVPPSRNVHFGECTPVVATPAWLGIFDHMQSVLRLHAPDGRPLSATRIAPLLAVPTEIIAAVGATPGFVGVGASGIVGTFTVQVPAGCPAER